jgi:hypothetical protein
MGQQDFTASHHTYHNLRQKEINFPLTLPIRRTNPPKSFLKHVLARFRSKIHPYFRKMSILPDCRVFDYSANFSTHDSTVPRISDVCCQRLTRERAYSPVLKYNEGLWKSQIFSIQSKCRRRNLNSTTTTI